MKRVVDKPYYTYYYAKALSTGVDVKCPKCHSLGIVTADKTTALFKCTECGYTQKKECVTYSYDVHNQCKGCGRYYRVDIKDEKKQHFPALKVACPYCKTVMSGKVHKTNKGYYLPDIKGGCEGYFGLELWFLSHFHGKPVWALDREHLAYLIDYLSADLRERPTLYNWEYATVKTQADHLPTFMKTAKNRDRIVKMLKDMQKK